MATGAARFITGPDGMRAERSKVLISFSRDMAAWAETVAGHIERVAYRLRQNDFGIVFWHRLEPELHNATEAWADHIVATSDPTIELVIVLVGERVGRPTPPTFVHRQRMAEALRQAGYGWIKVQGVDADFDTVDTQPDALVPLTGTLAEYLDAVLNARPGPGADRRPHVLLLIHGDPAKRDFGLGAERLRVAGIADRHKRKEAEAEYALQEAWLCRFYDGFIQPREAPELWFQDEAELLARVERALDHVFGHQPLDPFTVELPLLAAYEVKDTAIYFSFEAELQRLMARLTDAVPQPEAIILEGPSGAGKSSLLRAGLLAELGRPLRRMYGWRAGLCTPDMLSTAASPLAGLAQLIVTALRPEVDIDPAGDLDALMGLPAAAAHLQRRLRHHLAHAKPCRLVIIVDQAEALLDRLAAEEAAGANIGPWSQLFEAMLGLGSAAAPPAPGEAGRLAVHLVFGITALRAAGLRNRLADRPLADPVLLAANPNEAALRDIVGKTFDAMGLRLDPALVDQIAADARQLGRSIGAFDPPPILPLLAVSLAAVHRGFCAAAAEAGLDKAPPEGWPALPQSVFGPIAELGNAIELLGERAWEAAFPPPPGPPGRRRRRADPQQALQDLRFGRMMRGLVEVWASESGTRYKLVPRLLAATDPRLTDLPELVRALLRERLLLPAGGGNLRLAHESVLQHWRRAAAWLETEERHLQSRRRLGEDAHRWSEHGCAKDYLATRLPDLEEAAALLLAWGEDLDATAPGIGLGDFIRASLSAAYPFEKAAADSPLRRLVLDVCGLGETRFLVALLAIDPDLPKLRLTDNGASPLLIAAEQGHASIVAALLAAGADPNHATSDNARTALILAAQNGHASIVETLLAAGADPNHASSDDARTALILAAQNGHASIVETLLAAGADPNHASSDDARTALILAAQNGHASIVETLLAAGADPNHASSDDARTALIMAAQEGHASIVAGLLAASADPNHATSDDARTALIQAAQNGHASIVAALLAAGADPNHAQSNDARTALIQAAQNGHASIVTALLVAGADPNHATSDDARTALILAAQEGHASIVAALLAAGADPNHAQSNDARTALIQAAQEGHTSIVETLLAAGADPNHAQSNDARTALILAAQNGHGLIVAALLAAGADPNHAQSNDARTALILAAQNVHASIVATLLAAGADPNHAQSDDARTALIQAAQNGHASIVTALLAAGADPNRSTSDDARTALIMAAQNGHTAIVTALRAAGADPNHAGRWGGPLDLALRRDHAVIASNLVAAGARCTAPPGRRYKPDDLPHRLMRAPLQPVAVEGESSRLVTALGVAQPAKMSVLPLPALGDAKLLRIGAWSEAEAAPALRFVLAAPGALAIADGSNAPFYSFVSATGLDLSHPDLADYAIAFFALVKAKDGSFTIVERAEDLPWLEPASEADREELGTLVQPIRALGGSAGLQRLRASMVFRKALFESDINIEASGTIELTNETLIRETLPIRDDAEDTAPDASDGPQERAEPESLAAQILAALPQQPGAWTDRPLLPLSMVELAGEALAAQIAGHFPLLREICGRLGFSDAVVPERGRRIAFGESGETRVIEYQLALPIESGETLPCLLMLLALGEDVGPVPIAEGAFVSLGPLLSQLGLDPIQLSAAFLALEPNRDSLALPIDDEADVSWAGRIDSNWDVKAGLAIRKPTVVTIIGPDREIERCWLEEDRLYRGLIYVSRDPAKTELQGEPQVLLEGMPVKRRRALLDGVLRYMQAVNP